MQVQHPVKIAVIGGSGYIGQRHCEYIRKNSLIAQLVSIVDPSEAAIAIAARYTVLLYATVDELLNNIPKPDACIVCTPNHTHVPICIQLAEGGIKAILCEKPISTTVASARSLIQIATQHNVQLLIGHHRRFSPWTIALKEVLASGVLGDITAISGLWTALKPAAYFTNPQNNWRASKSTGGGVILNNFIHEIDLLQHLFGPVSRIHAEKGISRRRSKPASQPSPDQPPNPTEPNSSPLEETLALTLRFQPHSASNENHNHSIIGTFLISDHLPSPHNFESATGENPSIPFTPNTDIYRIFGTRGTLSFPDMTLCTYRDPDPDPDPDKNEGINDEEEQGNGSWHQTPQIRKIMVRNRQTEPLGEQLKYFVGMCNRSDGRNEDGVDDFGVVEMEAKEREAEAAVEAALEIDSTTESTVKGKGCTPNEGLSALKVCEAVMRAVDNDEGGGTVSIDPE